jgi:acetoin utilization protein AcuB
MIIEEVMKKEIITLNPKDTIEQALQMIHLHRIRHIPIVNDLYEIVGIVSDRDIRDASPSIFQLNSNRDELQRPIETIMICDVITGHPLDFVEDVASIFFEHSIGCLPIEKAGKLIGIVTETDILHTLVQLTGAHQPSSQIEVKVENKKGMLSEVASIFRDQNINIISVLVYPDQTEQHKILVFRVQTMNPTSIIMELKNKGYHVLWPNVPGIST